jgi:hypothetical protein
LPFPVAGAVRANHQADVVAGPDTVDWIGEQLLAVKPAT